MDGLDDSLPKIPWLPFIYRSARASDVWVAGSSPSWGGRKKFRLLTETLETTGSMLKHQPAQASSQLYLYDVNPRKTP